LRGRAAAPGREHDNAGVITASSTRAAELRAWLRTWWPPSVEHWARGRQVGLLYAVVVLVISLMVALQPEQRLAVLVERSSTNLANMSTHPFAVLFLSALVVSPAAGLVLLVPVVIAYGEIQRWVGVGSTVLIVVFGHVGATLVVMMLEITALRDHLVRLNIAVRPDVGVSYGMFAALGALLFLVPLPWRWAYGLGCLAVVVGLLIVVLDFTNLGHASAWLIGLALSWLLRSAGRRDARGYASRYSA
jgi:Rhomboid-like protein